LYSVLLNDAPARVVADFIHYEKSALGERWRSGPDSSPATLAAVGRADNLRLLLEAGMPVDLANGWGKTAPMSAAEQNQLDGLRRRLQRRANVRARTQWRTDTGVGGMEQGQGRQGGQTALLLAAQVAGAELSEALVQAGAQRQAWEGYDRQVCQALNADTPVD